MITPEKARAQARPAMAEPLAPPELPSRHPYLRFLLRAALGIAVVTVLIWTYNARPVLRVMSRERLAYFLAAVGVYAAGLALSAFRWKLLAERVSIRAPLLEFVLYCFLGAFTNLFVPGLVGGDAARAYYLGRRYRRLGAATVSVVVDRGVGFIALFWLATAAALMLRAHLPAALTELVVAAGGAALIAYAGAPVAGRMLRFLPKRLSALEDAATPYLQRPRVLLGPIAISLVFQAMLASCQYLLALGLGLRIPLLAFMLCVPLANVVASLPLTLNGLGLREAAYLTLLRLANVGNADAIALGLLWFLATALVGLAGAIAFVVADPEPRGPTEDASAAPE